MVSSESLIADGTHPTEMDRNAHSRSLSAENVNNSTDVRNDIVSLMQISETIIFKVDGYEVIGF